MEMCKPSCKPQFQNMLFQGKQHNVPLIQYVKACMTVWEIKREHLPRLHFMGNFLWLFTCCKIICFALWWSFIHRNCGFLCYLCHKQGNWGLTAEWLSWVITSLMAGGLQNVLHCEHRLLFAFLPHVWCYFDDFFRLCLCSWKFVISFFFFKDMFAKCEARFQQSSLTDSWMLKLAAEAHCSTTKPSNYLKGEEQRQRRTQRDSWVKLDPAFKGATLAAELEQEGPASLI